MAALIKTHLQLDTDLVEGKRGEFTVWVDEVCVAKKGEHGFPDDMDVLEAVTRAAQA